jgi:hypothetical protein
MTLVTLLPECLLRAELNDTRELRRLKYQMWALCLAGCAIMSLIGIWA